MSDHIYELGSVKTTGAAAGPVITIVPGTLGAGIRMPQIREIGIYSQSGVAAQIGLGIPAAAGAGAVTGGTVQALNQLDPAGHTQVATSFATTQPTAPTNFYRRADIQAVQGAGAVWAWDEGEFLLWSDAVCMAPGCTAACAFTRLPLCRRTPFRYRRSKPEGRTSDLVGPDHRGGIGRQS